MIKIDIRTNFPDVQRTLRNLRTDIADRAVTAALNKTADKARTEMRRGIVSEFDIKAKDVNPRITVQGASAKTGKLTAILEALPGSRRGRSRNVVAFLRRRVSLAQARKGKQLGFRFKRGGPVKQIEGAFVGNQGRTVFIRQQGAKRLPIKALQVIDVGQMFNTRRIQAKVVARIEREFPVEFNRAVRLYLERFNRA
jgi:hypothetical protein